jgi:hypothetical protein
MKPPTRRARKATVTFPAPTTPQLTVEDRCRLAAKLLHELFVETRRHLLHWADITGQSAQVDSGYIAQHLVSLVTGIPGHERRRGKGLDLADKSEVKTANNVDGVDKQRWNIQFTSEETMDGLLKHPFIFMVLFDFVVRDSEPTGELRARIWGITPSTDTAFREAFGRWRTNDRKSRNYQLHPPIGRDDDIVTNDSGNLRMPKMFEAIIRTGGSIDVTMLHERPTGACEPVSIGRWDRTSGLAADLEGVSDEAIEEAAEAAVEP